MTQKRSSPLNNPSQEKSPVVAVPGIKNYKPGTTGTTGSGKGVRQGGKPRVMPVEVLLRCQMCGHVQKLVFGYPRVPEWHRCVWCNELQPVAGYKVVGYGLGIPQPLAPFQVARRVQEAEFNAEYNPHG